MGTIRRVQRFAKEAYTHPIVLLSIPEDTDEDVDPPLEGVTFTLESPADVEPFLIPHITAMEKAFHGWNLSRPAIVTFDWSASVRGADRSSSSSTRELFGVSVDVAPRAEDEIRFLVGGTDVRAYMLKSRQTMRDLRASARKAFEEGRGKIKTRLKWPLAVKSLPRIEKNDEYETVLKKYRAEHSPETLKALLRLAYWQESNKS